MARFSATDARTLRILEGELATVTDGGPSALDWALPALRDSVGAERGFAFRYKALDDGLALEYAATDRISPALVSTWSRWLVGKPTDFTLYNPVRPEATQRNVLLDPWTLGPREELVEKPVFRVLFRPFGLADDAVARVLLCERSSLLAHIEIRQSAPFAERQWRMLRRILPALRRRLSVERTLESGPSTGALLLAALEEIPAPAFVLDGVGTVLEANAAGSDWLGRDAKARRGLLRDAVRACESRRGDGRVFRVARVATPGGSVRYLAVLKRSDSADHRCAAAARAWGFTPRETELLALLSDGLITRTIAAEMKVAERTVEFYLTRMFEKAQVESRAELVVRALRRSLS